MRLMLMCVDPEDLRGQPICHHAAEAEHVSALSGHEHVSQQACGGGRTQHLPRLPHSHQGAALPGQASIDARSSPSVTTRFIRSK